MKSKVRILAHFLLVQFGYAFTDLFSPTFACPGGPKSPTSIPMVATISEAGILLKNRLIEAGIKSTDLELQAESKLEDVEPASSRSSISIVHVKTLVWEVSCSQNGALDGNAVEKIYIVTAQKMTDRVDVKLLQDLVHKQQDLLFGCAVSGIAMAPTDQAEYMTGFQSGCMPPIGHNIPMKLYVDESITESAMASVGSGSLGHSLILPTRDLLKVAETNEQGLLVGSFIKSARSGSPSSVLETNSNGAPTKHEKKPKNRGRSEPKDRLKEYKSMTSTTDKAQLFRTTVRKKGRVEMMKELIDEAVETGDFPQLMLTSEGVGINKNALHLCSWKGDFETVKYLVETSKKHYPELDIVNTISKSDGNHGKTPIFYALTQCREDVVRYLVSEGASLLFVNNKGQTPCSIAVSHVEEDVCQFLFAAESEQIRNGGVFANFRTSHSDGKLYGDLDPRFDIDPDNAGDDLKVQIDDYRQSLANGATSHNGIPTRFSPRSLRPTIRWWKRDDKSLGNANDVGTSNQITFTQPRAKADRKDKAEEKSYQRKTLPRSPTAPKQMKVLDIDSLDSLTLDEVHNSHFSNGCTNNDESKTLVNCLDSIRALELEIDRTIFHAKTLAESGNKTVDEAVVETTWGLDCEWFPGRDCGRDDPVATLQLSTQKRSFLIDLQSLCQALHLEQTSGDYPAPNEIEAELNRVLSKLFADENVPLIGFGVLADLGKLAASFPHLDSFSRYSAVIDLQKLSTIAFSKTDRQNVSSLQAMVALILNRRLDKSQQCSDWTRRPFTSEQVEYATLDAAVLPFILKRIIANQSNPVFGVHTQLTSNVRFTFLSEDDGPYNVPMGKTTLMFSKEMARQCWPTCQVVPDLPTKRIIAEPRPSKKERAHLRKVGTATGGKRPKPIQLRDTMGKLDDLPSPGTTLGYTKDSCVHRVVGHAFIDSLPDRTHIGFNRRSGVSETRNAWMIFCNFGGPKSVGRPCSGFLKDGREFRFNLKPKNDQRKSSEKSLCDFLSSRQEIGLAESIESDRKILLFARGSTRHKYTYCGSCECLRLSPAEFGSMDLLLTLVDYSELVGENISQEFSELVQVGGAHPAADLQIISPKI